MARRWAATAVGIVVLAVASACGGSDYRYVSNTEEQVYFKIPKDWARFDEESDGVWFRGFSAGGTLVVEGTEASPQPWQPRAAPVPRGYAQIVPLGQEAREQVSLTLLRATALGVLGVAGDDGNPIDPVDLVRAEDGSVEIFEYEELALDNGARGVQIGLRVVLDGQEEPQFLNHVALVDKGAEHLIMFSVGCVQACWDEHENVITEVVESWTVED